ncbi:MAG: type II toxin-antitoxin system VapB family antitoxin [Armatimonadota bacterium]
MPKTLLDIDANLLDRVRALARARTKREAVEIALREYVRRRYAARLAQAAGGSSMRWKPSNIRAMREGR